MRTPVLALVFLLAAISGCMAGNEAAPKDNEPTGPAPLPRISVFGPGVPDNASQAELIAKYATGNTTFFTTDENGAEPSIGVTKSGAVFTNGFDNVIRSKDKGVTWEVVQTLEFGNSDPMMWVDPITDRIYHAPMYPTLLCSSIYTSEDDGETWGPVNFDCSNFAAYDHQKLTSGPPGPKPNPGGIAHPTVLYMCYATAMITTNCGASYNGGLDWTWDLPIDFNQDNGCDWTQVGKPAVSPSGIVVVPRQFSCPQPILYVSEDSGLTWVSHKGPKFKGNPAKLVGLDPDVDFTTDNTLYLSYQDPNNRQYVARSKTYGASFDEPFDVTPPGINTTVFGVVSAGDKGRIAVSFLGAAQKNHSSSTEVGAPWHLYIVTSDNADAERPIFVAYRVTPDEDPAQYGKVHQGGGGAATRNMLDFIDSAMGPDGTFWVGYTEGYAPGKACTNENNETPKNQSTDRCLGVARLDGWSLKSGAATPHTHDVLGDAFAPSPTSFRSGRS